MRIEYDPRLIEDVAFAEVRRREAVGDGTWINDYHRRTDALYSGTYAHPDDRDLAFRDVHAAMFRELRMEQLLNEVLAEFPVLLESVGIVTFLRAASRKHEHAELFVRHDEGPPARTHRSAALRVRTDSFMNPDALRGWLRRELMHLQDMVDPAFGYTPSLGETGMDAARENLLRDRYKVLWAAYIEARLVRAGQSSVELLRPVAVGIDKTFRSVSPEERERIFSIVCDVEVLRHEDLLDLIRMPGPVASNAAPVVKLPTVTI